jgi:hypothetical protein
MIFYRLAIFFAIILSATSAEDLLRRKVNCNSLGSVGTAASSYCSSILRVSAATISASNPTIVYTLTSTKTITGSIVTKTGKVVTQIQTKTASVPSTYLRTVANTL